MSQSTAVKKASFWGESYPAIIAMVKTEWRWVIGFATLLAVLQFIALLAVGQDAVQLFALMNKLGISSTIDSGVRAKALASLSQVIPLLLSYYFFITLYLRREAKSAPPQFSINNFFYWVWKVCIKYLYIMGTWIIFMLIAALIISVAFVVDKIAKLSLPGGATGMVLVVLAMSPGLYFYIQATLRTYIVSPLAILHREPVLKNSKDLTKGQCWRIFCGLFILFVCLILLSLVPLITGMLTSKLPMSLIAQSILPIILQSLCSAVSAVASSVYCCTVYRLLLQEQKSNLATITPSLGV